MCRTDRCTDGHTTSRHLGLLLEPKTLTFLKVTLGITCHEILSFGRRPYKDVRPKLGKGKEALAEFLKKKKTMDAPKKYFPMGFDNDHVEVMFQKIVK